MRTSFLLLAATALGVTAKSNKTEPIYAGSKLPSNDSFYHPDAKTLQKAKNGAVLASRRVNTTIANYPTLSKYQISSYQVLYKTEGANGEPLSGVTTVWVPAKNGRKNQLVAYSTPEDSSFINCAPSYSYLTNSTKLNSNNNNEEPIIALLLNKGFTVTSSDYESNELSAFTAGHVAGHGVLDGLRAALAFEKSNLDRKAKVAALGYSGGAIATAWASALQPSYAPDLEVVGFGFGGTPANISDALQHLDGGVAAGYDVAGLAGLMAAYPKFRDYINSVLTPAGKDAIKFAQSHCVIDDLVTYGGKMIESSTYESKGESLVQQPEVQAVYKQNVLGSNKKETPGAPIFAVHCSDDEIADYMIGQWCNNKAPSITYRRDVSGTCKHGTEWVRTFPQLFPWLDERFAGSKKDLPRCSITNVTLSVPSADALGKDEEPIFSQIIAANQK